MSLKKKDSSLSFGIQNFLFVKGNEDDSTYNYYAFQTHNGSILIMRTNKSATEALYFVNQGVFSTIWDARADVATVYVLPNELQDQLI